uniref:Uncharacterized protein n=1 Tax=Meloidogyne floridensis TaxID=298350 RepID=A0A915NY54_9BILA
MNELEQIKIEMRSIRRSLDNCYVENNALMALVETQHLEIREIIGDVDMIYNKTFKRENSYVMEDISSKIYNVKKEVKLINEDLTVTFKYLNNIHLNNVNLNEYNKEKDNNQINLSLEDEHLTLNIKLKKLQNFNIYTLNMQKLDS